MNCQKAKEMISLYIDHQLCTEEKIEFEGHIKECKDCYDEYLALSEIVERVNNIKEVPLPEGFKNELRHTLENTYKENKGYKKKSKTNFFRKRRGIAAIFLVGIFISALLIGDYSPFKGYKDMGMEMAQEDSAEISRSQITSDTPYSVPEDKLLDNTKEGGEVGFQGDESSQGTEGIPDFENMQEKIIYSASISLQVNDFNKAFDDMMDYVEEMGGFVQHSSDYNPYDGGMVEKNQEKRQGYIFIRIPQENFEKAMGFIEKMGKVTSKERTGENITAQYRDVEVEVKNLEVQEQRLVEILKEANKVSDILDIERELNRVRTEINQRKTRLNNWDKLVKYASIEVNISQEEISDTNIQGNPFQQLGQKIQQGLIQSINMIVKGTANFIVFIAKAIPFLILAFILYLIYRKWLRDKVKDQIHKYKK